MNNKAIQQIDIPAVLIFSIKSNPTNVSTANNICNAK